MPPQIDDPVLEIFAAGMFLVSIATCIVLLVMARLRGPLLPFVPRRPVPWNVVGAILTGVMVFTAVAAGIGELISGEPAAVEHAEKATGSRETKPDHKPGDLSSTALQLIYGTSQELVLVGGALAFIAVYFRASRRDLGLPANVNEFACDVFIGGVVGIASLAPIRIIQGVLLTLWGAPEMESGHPLVKMLTDGKPSVILMLLASFAAVVVAPLCEEISFRLLLQGWLEKWEAVRLGNWAENTPNVSPECQEADDLLDGMTNDEFRMKNEGIPINAANKEHSSIINHQSSIE